jgi:hypothetical protein
VRLKQQVIESLLPRVKIPVTNGYDQGSPPEKKRETNEEEEEGEKRQSSLIASQPASIQTEVLSPASEQKLLSFPLPKSAITVVGHGDQDTSPESPSTGDNTPASRNASGFPGSARTSSYGQGDFSVSNVENTGVKHLNSGPSDQPHPSAAESEHHSSTAVSSVDQGTIGTEVKHADNTDTVTADMEVVGEKSASVPAEEFDAEQAGGSLDSGCGQDDETEVKDTTASQHTSASDTAARSLYDEMAVANGGGLNTSTIPSCTPPAVGFDADGDDMDKEEMEAYLKDLEDASMSDSEDTAQEEKPASAEKADDGAPAVNRGVASISESGTCTAAKSEDVSDGKEDMDVEDGSPKTLTSIIAVDGSRGTPASVSPESTTTSVDNQQTGKGVSGLEQTLPSVDQGDKNIDAMDKNSANVTVDSAQVEKGNSCRTGSVEDPDLNNSRVGKSEQPDVVADASLSSTSDHPALTQPPETRLNGELATKVESESFNENMETSSTDDVTCTDLADNIAASESDMTSQRLKSSKPEDDGEAVESSAQLAGPQEATPPVPVINSMKLTDVGNTDAGVAKKDSPSPPVMKSNLNLGLLPPSGSLDFPAVSNKGELGSVMKGKLEIEGLLDEIVAARQAHKSSMNADSGHGSPELLKGGGEENGRTYGVGPEGSMVSSLSREKHSQSPDVVTPTSTSPSPTLGIGARPKDPSQMKKNRPNSLLGLSKVSLTSPFSPPQQLPPNAGPQVYSGVSHPGGESERMVDVSDVEMRSQVSRQLGAPVGPDTRMQGDGMPAPTVMDFSEGMVGEGGDGTQRPQSWAPAGSSPSSAHKMKRPTSLNLPVRQDRVGSTSPDGETFLSRKADFLKEAGLAPETASSG